MRINYGRNPREFHTVSPFLCTGDVSVVPLVQLSQLLPCEPTRRATTGAGTDAIAPAAASCACRPAAGKPRARMPLGEVRDQGQAY